MTEAAGHTPSRKKAEGEQKNPTQFALRWTEMQ